MTPSASPRKSRLRATGARMIRVRFIVPEGLAESCGRSPEGSRWLDRLPGTIRALEERWSLELDSPFHGDEVSAAWVAPARRADGTSVVLKIGLPHLEAEHEIDGLRFWDGDPTVRLLDADDALGAMLLERCDPGTHLRTLPEGEQDVILAELLHRLWRVPPLPHPFRSLSAMLEPWGRETLERQLRWQDRGLVRTGLELFETLPRAATQHVLLATDLHAGNVLRAEREPWLVIDPKPFLGDPAYDATQHLLNCEERMYADPFGTIARFADLLELDRGRVRLWMFARVAAEPRDEWDDESTALARALAP